MRIQALYFGPLRARLGRDAEWLELAPGGTAGDAGRAATAACGPEWALTLRYALGDAFVPAERTLTEGDSLALLPPMSGG